MKKEKITTGLLLKSGFWYTVSQFLTKAMVFITMPLFTRIMTKAQYGDFTVFATWQSLLLTVCGIESYATLNRARFDYADEKGFNGYITSSLLASTLLTGLIFGIYLLFPHVFDSLFLLDKKYIWIMFAYLFTQPAFLMFQAQQRITYRYKLNAAIAFTLVVLSTVLAVVFVHTTESDRLYGRIIGSYSLYILAGIGFYIYYIIKSRSVSLSAVKYAVRLGVPLVFSYLGSQLFRSCDNIVLKHMCSAEEVGYLSVSHSCSHIMLLLVQTLNTAWAPWFFDMLELSENEKIRKTFRLYMWGIILGSFAVLLIGPEIIYILSGKAYHDSIYLLPANILSGFFTALTAQFVNVETYYKKTEYAGILTGVMALLNVALNIICVKWWGYRAVIYTTIFCQIILLVLHYAVTRKMGIAKIMPAKDIVIEVVMALVMIPLCLLLYQSVMIRVGCVLVLAAAAAWICITKRNTIMMYIRKFKNRKKEA